MQHLLIFALLSFSVIRSNNAMDVLMFGGNGFIGSHVSELLLEKGHKLTLINRDNWRWDTATTIKPKVDAVIMDRLSPKSPDFFMDNVIKPRLLNQKPANPFDLVIDFSAFGTKAFKPYFSILEKAKLAKHYVYISTDSVYEVCLDSPKRPGELINENDAKRPENEQLRQKLADFDKYGHKKLQVEEFLVENAGQVPYTILRLPDVLGERDSTNRWWKLQIWMENYRRIDIPLTMPSFTKTLPTSYVYVKDIARFIGLLAEKVRKSKKSSAEQQNKIYNLACDEPKLLFELLTHLKQSSNSEKAEVRYSTNDIATPMPFPSVTKGALSVSKLHHDFPDFQFTPWHVMIHNLVDFYKTASVSFPKERDFVIRELCEDLQLDRQTCDKLQTQIMIDAEKSRKEEL